MAYSFWVLAFLISEGHSFSIIRNERFFNYSNIAFFLKKKSNKMTEHQVVI